MEQNGEGEKDAVEKNVVEKDVVEENVVKENVVEEDVGEKNVVKEEESDAEVKSQETVAKESQKEPIPVVPENVNKDSDEEERNESVHEGSETHVNEKETEAPKGKMRNVQFQESETFPSASDAATAAGPAVQWEEERKSRDNRRRNSRLLIESVPTNIRYFFCVHIVAYFLFVLITGATITIGYFLAIY